jgi:hypothetical protein
MRGQADNATREPTNQNPTNPTKQQPNYSQTTEVTQPIKTKS